MSEKTEALRAAEFMAEKLGTQSLEMMLAINSLQRLVNSSKDTLTTTLEACVLGNDDGWWDAMYNLLVHYTVYAEVLQDFVICTSPLVEKERVAKITVKEATESLGQIRVMTDDLSEEDKAMLTLLPEPEPAPMKPVFGYGTVDVN